MKRTSAKAATKHLGRIFAMHGLPKEVRFYSGPSGGAKEGQGGHRLIQKFSIPTLAKKIGDYVILPNFPCLNELLQLNISASSRKFLLNAILAY